MKNDEKNEEKQEEEERERRKTTQNFSAAELDIRSASNAHTKLFCVCFENKNNHNKLRAKIMMRVDDRYAEARGISHEVETS